MDIIDLLFGLTGFGAIYKGLLLFDDAEMSGSTLMEIISYIFIGVGLYIVYIVCEVIKNSYMISI